MYHRGLCTACHDWMVETWPTANHWTEQPSAKDITQGRTYRDHWAASAQYETMRPSTWGVKAEMFSWLSATRLSISPRTTVAAGFNASQHHKSTFAVRRSGFYHFFSPRWPAQQSTSGHIQSGEVGVPARPPCRRLRLPQRQTFGWLDQMSSRASA